MAIIMSTGQGDELVAADAIKRGASDYLPKTQLNAKSIRYIVENALKIVALQRKLARQGEELHNFAHVLVHDLKAPLRSIQTLIGFLEENVHSGNVAAADEEIEGIVSVAKRLETLIDTLFQYTLASGRISFAPIETRHVVQDTLTNLHHLIQQRGAQITYGDLPALTGNAAELSQLLQNLISNGLKYCAAPIPKIHISATMQAGEIWLFSVRDNGIGIQERFHTRIFEPFRRLHNHEKYEGTGLGLATCKKIVERHGGKIWCESQEGEGSNFLFSLPSTPPISEDL